MSGPRCSFPLTNIDRSALNSSAAGRARCGRSRRLADQVVLHLTTGLTGCYTATWNGTGFTALGGLDAEYPGGNSSRPERIGEHPGSGA